jgi:ATP-dependent protease HslVU (ClpYQ) peptidase subunit
MTVVAVKDGIMAADKQTTFGSMRVSTTKIRRLADGRLAGASGITWRCKALLDWLEAGGERKDYPDPDGKECTMIVLDRQRRIWLYDGPTAFQIDAQFHAIGSGQDCALVAMHLGQGAADAVRVTSLFNVDCGLGVDTLEIDAPA